MPTTGPSSITEVNVLFEGVVGGVSKLSSSRIHLPEVALVWGLPDAPLSFDILSGLIVARCSFNSLQLR